MKTTLRRAKPGAVVKIGELPPTPKEDYQAGYITEAEYLEMCAHLEIFKTLPAPVRRRGVTITQTKRDPRFQSVLAHHAGITRSVRPAGAARERRDRRTSSPSRAGPGDDSESSEPPPRRLCQYRLCEADISHLDARRDHCDNACKQAAYRDRRTVEQLDEKAGTTAEGCPASVSRRATSSNTGAASNAGIPGASLRVAGLTTRAYERVRSSRRTHRHVASLVTGTGSGSPLRRSFTSRLSGRRRDGRRHDVPDV